MIARITLDEAIRAGDLRFQDLVVPTGPDEHALLDAAERLVIQATGNERFALQIRRTRPTLHSMLLRIANQRPLEPVDTGSDQIGVSSESASHDFSRQAWELPRPF